MVGKWTFWYNTDRPHFVDKMNGKTPYEKLKECGYKVPIEFCMFSPIILDNVATNIILNFSKRGGNDLCDYDTGIFFFLVYILESGIMDIVEVAGKMLEWGELDVEKCSIGLRGGRKVKEGEKGDYLQGRSDVKPGIHSPFYHKPSNVFIHGEAICGGRGCIRACMIHLEKQGKLKNKFKDPFRKETPWRVNWD